MTKLRKQKFINLWLPPVLWAALIFWFSTLPTTPTSMIYWQDFIIKKSAHVFEYGIFATLLYRALKESGFSKRKAAFWAILTAVLYGVTDEFHQSFTPGREPRFRDVIFDTIGASLAIFSIWKALPKAPTRLKSWAKSFQLL